MLKIKNDEHKYAIFAGMVALAALCLRLYKLDFQSLWLDELYTMKECNPKISWKETLDLVLVNECKSPLYFLGEKLMFCLFGYSAFVARLLSAMAGAASVYAMFLLGKEVVNARTGCVAALLTCVNAFHIHYSQEARGYMLLFLFCVLSLLFFVRTLKSLNLSTAALYGLCALLTLHFHPFGVLLLFGQGIVIAIYFFTKREKQRRMAFIKCFGLAYALVLVGLLPLVSSLKNTAAITSMWIPMPAPDYFKAYFFEFFGNSGALEPLLFAFLIGYVVYTFKAFKKEDGTYSGLSFSFVLIFTSLVVGLLVPYLYSILKIPVLVIRYMVVVLPLLLLPLSIGIAYIENKLVRSGLLFVFITISLLHLAKHYYAGPIKTQYRELAEYIKANSPQPYPVIHHQSPWQLSYYFERLDIRSEIISINKNEFVDGEKNGSIKLTSFWLAGAHNDPMLSAEKMKVLESKFVLVRSKSFLDAWAQLFMPADSLHSSFSQTIDHKQFEPKDAILLDHDTIVVVWDNNFVTSRPVILSEPGSYKINIMSKGLPCKGIYPHVIVYVNNTPVGDYSPQGEYSLSPLFDIDVPANTSFVLKFKMDNEETNANTKEDRNAFIKSIHILRY